MTADPGEPSESADIPCARERCGRVAAFRVYTPGADRWRPLCQEHTRSLHPSLEIKAWLESGYAKPVELGKPTGAPADPETGRQTAFREMVDRAMDWDGAAEE